MNLSIMWYCVPGIVPNGTLVADTRPHRAMRHCIASGLLARDVGCECAECVGTKRELFNYLYGPFFGASFNKQQTLGATERALTNNRQGRLCAGCLGPSGSTTQNRFLPGPGLDTPEPRYDLMSPAVERSIVDCCKNALYRGELMQTGVVPPGAILPALPAQPPAGTGPAYGWREQLLIWLAF